MACIWLFFKGKIIYLRKNPIAGRKNRNPKLIDTLKECISREDIDKTFEEYEVSDFQCRGQILRKAMNCLMMLNASIKNPRIKRENLSAERTIEASPFFKKNEIIFLKNDKKIISCKNCSKSD